MSSNCLAHNHRRDRACTNEAHWVHNSNPGILASPLELFWELGSYPSSLRHQNES